MERELASGNPAKRISLPVVPGEKTKGGEDMKTIVITALVAAAVSVVCNMVLAKCTFWAVEDYVKDMINTTIKYMDWYKVGIKKMIDQLEHKTQELEYKTQE